ncbi:peroxisomal (s)-2-hydroxy-acid oxidase [Phtheirospermum japonicum]|uniref:Peroxisomal (S)-2-hydroxy-acid oxidase n=1 Tax=Phtheirospermum japonicum TaxID=374723 RepID=A0A830CF70_9LAMI|nr:peroxisomal (s)-2-hydroxy-acid oxidase [Phtheirospermum japonicum]
MVFDYYASGADDHWTLGENRNAFSRILFLVVPPHAVAVATARHFGYNTNAFLMQQHVNSGVPKWEFFLKGLTCCRYNRKLWKACNKANEKLIDLRELIFCRKYLSDDQQTMILLSWAVGGKECPMCQSPVYEGYIDYDLPFKRLRPCDAVSGQLALPLVL